MSHPGENRWLHRYAVMTAGATFFLIIAGALVTSNDAGLAVPDWPLSYGRLMPPMVGGIFYEHGHRMVATAVGLLTIGLAVWLQIREPRRWVRRLGWAALGAVIVQGILGGITVLYFLPPAVSVSHASLAQLFFCLTVTLALVTSPAWKSGAGTAVSAPDIPLFHLAAATTGAVYAQLLLGAAVRHSVLGVMPHVAGALVVAALGFLTTARVLRRHGDVAALRRPALALGGLLLAQIFLGLGAYVVKYMREEIQPLPLTVAITTAHVACGALGLAAALALALRARRWSSAPPDGPEHTLGVAAERHRTPSGAAMAKAGAITS